MGYINLVLQFMSLFIKYVLKLSFRKICAAFVIAVRSKSFSKVLITSFSPLKKSDFSYVPEIERLYRNIALTLNDDKLKH